MVGLGRLELPTYGLGNRRSIHLSYSPEANPPSDYHRQYMGCESGDSNGHERPEAAICLRALRAPGSFYFSYVCYYRLVAPFWLARPTLRRSS
jgi:hypothetical protein